MTQLPGSNLTLPAPPPQIQYRPTSETSKGTNLLRSLYVTTAAMQALDVHSTFASLDRGGVEANPMMSGITKHRVTFSAMKAGVAATSILAAHKIGKRNKVAAIALLVGINSAYAAVVSHNYRVANRLAK